MKGVRYFHFIVDPEGERGWELSFLEDIIPIFSQVDNFALLKRTDSKVLNKLDDIFCQGASLLFPSFVIEDREESKEDKWL